MDDINYVTLLFKSNTLCKQVCHKLHKF